MTRTVNQAQRWARERLPSSAGSARRREIDTLLAHILGIPTHELYLSPDRSIGTQDAHRFQHLWEERLRGKPLQLLLGETEFFSLTFRVDAGVFIPRPETECLVQAALERIQRGAGVWIDVGTGAGVLAVSLAVHRPRLTLWATDVSMKALRLAGKNAHRHRVAEHIRRMRGDLLEPFKTGCGVDGIVSNPPYVPTAEMAHLPAEVRDYDPPPALNGGSDGLLFVHRLIARATEVLRRGGTLALEIGDDQADRVKDLFDSRWDGVEIRRDLAGRPRVVLATL